MSTEKLIGLSGGQILHDMLVRHGVKYVFGYPGGAMLPLLDGLYQSTQIKFILSHHEQGTGHMAEGYARASGRPRVVLVTSGPGTTNMVTPMMDALLDGTPIGVICGQVESTVLGTGAFQEIDVETLANSCTKWNTCVQRTADLPAAVDMAFHQAMEG